MLLSSIPPVPVTTSGQGFQEPTYGDNPDGHSAISLPDANAPKDVKFASNAPGPFPNNTPSKDMTPAPSTVISRPVPIDPSVIPPPAPKDVKLAPIAQVLTDQVPKDNAPAPVQGLPSPFQLTLL